MKEGAPEPRKKLSQGLKDLFTVAGVFGVAVGANAVLPQEGAQKHKGAVADSETPGALPKEEVIKPKETQADDEAMRAYAAFLDEKEASVIDGMVSYVDPAERSIRDELRSNALAEYLRNHLDIGSRLKEISGGAPIIAGESSTVYVYGGKTQALDFLGAYTGIKNETHLFDLVLTRREGQLGYDLSNPAPELGLPEEK
jgi:hypothetical protein